MAPGHYHTQEVVCMTRTYAGRCHCGAVRFRFRSEEITRGIRCNCSICIRRGAVMSVEWIPPEDLELLEGKETLTLYRFGDTTMNHYFCPSCGIHPFAEVIRRPGWYRFNLGCVDGLEPYGLDIELIDGRSF
jgi:hypothetical protein